MRETDVHFHDTTRKGLTLCGLAVKTLAGRDYGLKVYYSNTTPTLPGPLCGLCMDTADERDLKDAD